MSERPGFFELAKAMTYAVGLWMIALQLKRIAEALEAAL